jgi:hypothetical protein
LADTVDVAVLPENTHPRQSKKELNSLIRTAAPNLFVLQR